MHFFQIEIPERFRRRRTRIRSYALQTLRAFLRGRPGPLGVAGRGKPNLRQEPYRGRATGELEKAVKNAGLVTQIQYSK